jgi:hypothetical protein
MKHRHLRLLGFRVISVSYREWEDAGKGADGVDEARCALLSRKLALAMAVDASPSESFAP